MINKTSYNDLLAKVNERLELKPEVRKALPIHSIINIFRTIVAEKQDEKVYTLSKKVQLLSQEKLEYYNSRLFGLVLRLFSSLRNFWNSGKFISSGQMGLDLSTAYIKANLKKFEPAVPEVPSVIKIEEKPNKVDSPPQPEIKLTESNSLPIPLDKKEELPVSTSSSSSLEQLKASCNQEAQQIDVPFALTPTSPPKSPEAITVTTPISEKVKKENAKLQELQKLKDDVMSGPHAPLIKSLSAICKQAGELERTYIELIFAAIVSCGKLKNWNQSHNTFHLEFHKEIKGKHSDLPGYVECFILNQKMKITFSEENDTKKNTVQYVLKFEENSICARGKILFVTSDFSINKLIIEKGPDQMMCKLETWLGMSIERDADTTLSTWKGTKWE